MTLLSFNCLLRPRCCVKCWRTAPSQPVPSDHLPAHTMQDGTTCTGPYIKYTTSTPGVNGVCVNGVTTNAAWNGEEGSMNLKWNDEGGDQGGGWVAGDLYSALQCPAGAGANLFIAESEFDTDEDEYGTCYATTSQIDGARVSFKAYGNTACTVPPPPPTTGACVQVYVSTRFYRRLYETRAH
jgi:hypothetical protein